VNFDYFYLCYFQRVFGFNCEFIAFEFEFQHIIEILFYNYFDVILTSEQGMSPIQELSTM
jgi:hypothetical protein